MQFYCVLLREKVCHDGRWKFKAESNNFYRISHQIKQILIYLKCFSSIIIHKDDGRDLIRVLFCSQGSRNKIQRIVRATAPPRNGSILNLRRSIEVFWRDRNRIFGLLIAAECSIPVYLYIQNRKVTRYNLWMSTVSLSLMSPLPVFHTLMKWRHSYYIEKCVLGPSI